MALSRIVQSPCLRRTRPSPLPSLPSSLPLQVHQVLLLHRLQHQRAPPLLLPQIQRSAGSLLRSCPRVPMPDVNLQANLMHCSIYRMHTLAKRVVHIGSTSSTLALLIKVKSLSDFVLVSVVRSHSKDQHSL